MYRYNKPTSPGLVFFTHLSLERDTTEKRGEKFLQQKSHVLRINVLAVEDFRLVRKGLRTDRLNLENLFPSRSIFVRRRYYDNIMISDSSQQMLSTMMYF